MHIKDVIKKADADRKQMMTKEGFRGVSFVDGWITFDGSYSIELAQIKTPGDLLKWVAHLSAKNWITREHIYHLIKIVSDVNGFNPYLCGKDGEL